jgi:uncharacterized protein (DUF2252 family)
MVTTAERAPATERATRKERAARGKALRTEVPRTSHGDWEPARRRPKPIKLLEEQAAVREPSLVPIRYGRMAASPFAFYRGAAYVLASDLARSPATGIRVQLCGDAHLANFGGFASPERDLVFDLNDFDETLPGPWEWDIKRLAASIEVAARARDFGTKERTRVVRSAVESYRIAMRRFAGMKALETWYTSTDVRELRAEFGAQLRPEQLKKFEKAIAKGKSKDSARAYNKLAVSLNGSPRIAADPPLITPIEDLLPDAEAHQLDERMRGLIAQYAQTLPDDRRRLLSRFRYVHAARKVVGVGSVGTRAWICLMLGQDSEPLFLQAKEAQPSVLAPFLGASEYSNQGQRVVEGQRLMQATSDIFLGWIHLNGIDGQPRDFYVRQLCDWKTSAEIETLVPEGMTAYGRMCGWTLARAHARSGDAMAIGAYLGGGPAFDNALTRFAATYADQNERDHGSLVDAIKARQVPAETGV